MLVSGLVPMQGFRGGGHATVGALGDMGLFLPSIQPSHYGAFVEASQTIEVPAYHVI